jgi:VWFA-related protein
MKRLLLLLLLFVCVLGWAGLMGLDFEQHRDAPDASRSTVNITYFDYNQTDFDEVTVYLSVTDATGEPVPGLMEEDFSIVEDDVPVDISGFTPGGVQPVTVLMLIDRSGSMDDDDKMEDAISAALTFLDQMEDERDHVGLIAFNQYIAGPRDLQLIDSGSRASLRSYIQSLTADGGTAYYDAIYEAVETLSGTSGRKVVLALTDGIDEDSGYSQSSVIEYAQDHNIEVYTIGLGRDVERASLEQIASETGGDYYQQPSSSDLAQLYSDLAQSLRAEYSLTYTSPTPRLDGTTREVAIAVETPGGTTTAESSYAVGGTLTPSPNLWPCLGALPLLALLALPGLYDRLRGRGRLAEPEPAPKKPPVDTPPPGPPRTGTAVVDETAVPPPTPASPRTGTSVMRAPMPSPPAPDAPSTCPACGKALRAGARFCPTCGQAARPAPQPEATCDYCAASLRPGARFCATCGQSIAAAPKGPTCARCGSPLKPGAQFCANCGQRQP